VEVVEGESDVTGAVDEASGCVEFESDMLNLGRNSVRGKRSERNRGEGKSSKRFYSAKLLGTDDAARVDSLQRLYETLADCKRKQTGVYSRRPREREKEKDN
jgi:hypothetical protein